MIMPLGVMDKCDSIDNVMAGNGGDKANKELKRKPKQDLLTHVDKSGILWEQQRGLFFQVEENIG